MEVCVGVLWVFVCIRSFRLQPSLRGILGSHRFANPTSYEGKELIKVEFALERVAQADAPEEEQSSAAEGAT